MLESAAEALWTMHGRASRTPFRTRFGRPARSIRGRQKCSRPFFPPGPIAELGADGEERRAAGQPRSAQPADGSGASEDREHDRVHRAIQACPPGTSIWCQFVKVAEMRTSDVSAKATAVGSTSSPLSPCAGNAAPCLGAPQGCGFAHRGARVGDGVRMAVTRCRGSRPRCVHQTSKRLARWTSSPR